MHEEYHSFYGKILLSFCDQEQSPLELTCAVSDEFSNGSHPEKEVGKGHNKTERKLNLCVFEPLGWQVSMKLP